MARRRGEFFTPACVVRTSVGFFKPYHGRVYDPCCGSGGMFVQSAQFVERHAERTNDISVYGQDSNPTYQPPDDVNFNTCIPQTKRL